MPDPYNPQSLNRYSYVNNNPLRYTDPTGHYCVEEDADGNTIQMDCDSWEPVGGGGSGNSGGGGSNGGGGNDDGGVPDLTAVDEELLEFCILHPYASNCTFALPPEQCDLTPVIGPPGTVYTAGGCQFAGYEIYTDLDNMDWGGLFFNGLGVAGGFALLIGTIGVISMPAGLAFYEGTQIAGFAYDIYQLDAEAVTVDLVLEVASQTHFGSQLVPGLGSMLDFVEMGEIWADAQVVVPIYEPYPRPLHMPP